MPVRESYRIRVTKDYLKFSAAHFIAYPGFREALHGHNYRVSVEVLGNLGPHGYVVDFGVVKRIARTLCERLDEKTIIPQLSDCLTTTVGDDSVTVLYEHDEFRFPRADVLLLPIEHSSAEELARFLVGEMWDALETEHLTTFEAVEIGVEESFGQAALYRRERTR